jgi:hypothetical protein
MAESLLKSVLWLLLSLEQFVSMNGELILRSTKLFASVFVLHLCLFNKR